MCVKGGREGNNIAHLPRRRQHGSLLPGGGKQGPGSVSMLQRQRGWHRSIVSALMASPAPETVGAGTHAIELVGTRLLARAVGPVRPLPPPSRGGLGLRTRVGEPGRVLEYPDGTRCAVASGRASPTRAWDPPFVCWHRPMSAHAFFGPSDSRHLLACHPAPKARMPATEVL